MYHSLRTARIIQNWTQKDLSKITGVSQTTISLIENGIVHPQERTKSKIEGVLGNIDWDATQFNGSLHRRVQH